ncbi:MAG: Cof-type HAD-IIB family hydrolase [Bacillota bacterium]|uniref:Cof-type HAD-IIB family hydrolase n=1 Tax=Virgibacillus salarius TaxID=447199 RepID=A0A941DWL6_9BACI|nr:MULTISPECIES: Cof-type HAD-IIB family hydrolase [Bacillaceae]NAZ09178.1 Cof-type HAD-IIB family hydrolase [Agaribacter marinus]MBR7796469.1 Cof-type HAD-IIB family hydrolase [Virgibacillus salarius]MCC2251153.1 Cof-type HAD-IIB family hydrolase [Virgibacillus sp. AGTR]MDY7045315.1 Cof-type HAD-IIB family hydrolase [Virgibacillus sp. M23]QRZ16815.1 Cof-type HAD-IIB family hydrolase [Virgibacillus sp. AGTR]
MQKKIVFFDIDGTLLDHHKQLPASTKEAIQELKNKGVYVAIATGRAPFMFEDIRKELDIHSYVSFNGQFVVFEGKTVYENPLEKEELANLYNKALDLDYPLVYLNNQEMRASVSDHPFISESMGSLKISYPKVDPDFYKVNKIHQALIFCENEQEKLFARAHDRLHFLRWHDYSCDILPIGGSKAVGVEKLIEASGLDLQDTYSFGDGLNDIEMLKETGTGIAMGNAVPELKKVADFTTASVDQDGIRKGLEYVNLV